MPGIATRFVLPILLSIAMPTATNATNFLEIMFDKHEAPGSVYLFDVILVANKNGATTCELQTPSGTYACFDVGGEFYPE